MLQAVVTASLSFLVFTFASLLVAIQVASGQLTPRIIATTLLQNEVVRYTVGLFMFTLLFAVTVQGRIEAKVHQLPLFVAALLAVACFAAFLYLIDSASKLLRPITILTNVGNSGIAVIKKVYPEPSLGPDVADSQRQKLSSPDRVIQHRGTSSIVLSVDISTLVDLAKSAGGVIEFVPQVGDFVAVDEPLFNLYGGARDRYRRTSFGHRFRIRAHIGAGSDICLSNCDRHRAKGTLPGDKRPDDRCPCY